MKFKVPNLITAQTIYEFLSPFLSMSESMDFLKEHKIWRGLRSYGFLSVLLIILGVAFGIVLVYFLIDAIRVVDDYAHSDMDTASMLGSIGDRFNQSFLLGGSKYMILILMEIIIFHVIGKTLTILKGSPQDLSFKGFVRAQKRMIKVAIRSWALEILVIAVVSLGLRIVGLSSIKPLPVFMIQAYFLGFALIDNYFERMGLHIKASAALAFNHAGLTLGLGVILSFFLTIPIVGPIFGMMLVSVMACLICHEMEQSNTLEILKVAELSVKE